MRLFRPFLFLLITIVLAACDTQSAPPTALAPTLPSLQPGKGMLQGEIPAAAQRWPEMSALFVYAAPFYGDKNGQGVYVLDPSLHPNAPLDARGDFQLVNLEPGSYVLIAGPNADRGQIVVDEQVKLRIFEIQADQTLSVGKLTLAP